MMHKLLEKADKLLKMAEPLLDKITDDTDDEVSGRVLDAATKIVELSHYLYEICMMKKKMSMYDNNMNMEYDEMAADNPKKVY